jgi:hypothetical protein
MNESDLCLEVRRPNVICDAFDNEVVAVNMETGTYYSLTGTASAVFNWLDQGAGVQALGRQVAAATREPVDRIVADIQSFADRLIEAGLVQKRGAQPVEVAVELTTAWTTPLVEEYTDMQDLLLLDPIHDVGQDGWPTRKEEPAAGA